MTIDYKFAFDEKVFFVTGGEIVVWYVDGARTFPAEDCPLLPGSERLPQRNTYSIRDKYYTGFECREDDMFRTYDECLEAFNKRQQEV